MPLKPLPSQSYRNPSAEDDDDLRDHIGEVADMVMPLPNSCEQPRTPVPQNLGVPSSALTFGSFSNDNISSGASTTSTVLTIYEDLEDQYSIVKDATSNNPFAPRPVRVVEDDIDTSQDDYSPTDELDTIMEEYSQSEKRRQDESSYHISDAEYSHTRDSEPESLFIDKDNDGLIVQERLEHPRLRFFGRNTITVGRPKVFTEAAVDDEISSDEELSSEEYDETEADEESDLADDNEEIDSTDDNEDGKLVAESADTAMTDPEELTARRPSASDSVWDNYEPIAEQLHKYDITKQTIKGHENWTEDQAKLHKLLTLRGVWPMFERTWTFHFKDREIYPWVYAPEDTTKKVAITAKSNDFRAAKALETLFDLSPLVCSYRQTGVNHKIGSLIRKTLRRYARWACYDAGVSDRDHLSTLVIRKFEPSDWADAVNEHNLQNAARHDCSLQSSDDDDENQDPMSAAMQRRLRKLAAQHRKKLVIPAYGHLPEYMWKYQEQPPLLYGFMIIQHIVMIISLDSSNPDNKFLVCADALDLSQADQWLWNALALALPVNMARNDLWKRRESMPVKRRELDDPDV